MRFKSFAAALFLTTAAVPAAQALLPAENSAPATEITIYNQDLALIKKSQKQAMKPGVNEVVFNEVARQMRPESAFIFGDGVKILDSEDDGV